MTCYAKIQKNDFIPTLIYIAAALNFLFGCPSLHAVSWTSQKSEAKITAESRPTIVSRIPTSGKVRYVSTTGSNKADGSAKNSWRTVQYALSQLKAGDTLYIMEGTYRESVKLVASGSLSRYITIQGAGKVVFDGTHLPYYRPMFDTNGQDYIKFKNIKVVYSRAGVDVNSGSHHIVIDGLKTEHSQFAVKMNNASFVRVKNSTAKHSRNAFRGDGNTHHVSFDHIVTYGAKDIYKGYDKNYLNGDGFIFESATHHLTFKNIVSHHNWDAGLDIKGSRVLIQNVVVYGNKNGLKLWGKEILVKNALVYGNPKQKKADGSTIDGMGLNARPGAEVVITNSTFADNGAEDVKAASRSIVLLQNSVIARKSSGKLLGKYGAFSQKNVIWYDRSRMSKDSTIGEAGLWADPQFVDWTGKNFRLNPKSPANELHAGYSYAGFR